MWFKSKETRVDGINCSGVQMLYMLVLYNADYSKQTF